MKIFFVALNSSYSHSCPAIFALKRGIAQADFDVSWEQWTINTPRRQVLADLFNSKADVFSFSVYIWNVEYVVKLVAELRQMMPGVKIILGGPQATGEQATLLKSCPGVDCLCLGEGERVLPQLLEAWSKGIAKPALPGILWQGQDNTALPPREDFASLPFLYTQGDLQALSSHILYYESSRGCPYSCIFCASAGEPLRQRPLDIVKEEMKILAGSKAKQIKFVDRTFNANPKRGIEIISLLLELYRPDLSWHFEISPYILPLELAEILAKAPPGYFRLEAGLQSLHPPTLKAIFRQGSWEEAKKNIQTLIKKDNLHLHLDLIAGLPHENWESFEAAFNQVHALAPHYLQLGFLKVLPGSVMAEKGDELGLVYSPYPPYQIIATPTLSPGELIQLGKGEEMLDAFYNCRSFRQSLHQLGRLWPEGALNLYLTLAKEKNQRGSLGLGKKIKMLWDLSSNLKEKDFLRDVLLFDYFFYNIKEPLPSEMQKNVQGQSITLGHRPILGDGGIYDWDKQPVRLRFLGSKIQTASGGQEFNYELV